MRHRDASGNQLRPGQQVYVKPEGGSMEIATVKGDWWRDIEVISANGEEIIYDPSAVIRVGSATDEELQEWSDYHDAWTADWDRRHPKGING